MCVGILDKNEEKMAVILFQNLEKKNIHRTCHEQSNGR